MNTIKSISQLDSLAEVLDDFDAFIVDQYGVLHDGHRPYAYAVDTLSMLMHAGKTVIILSNSGKRSENNIKRMQLLGFERSLYTEFVTSGDVALAKINEQFLHDSAARQTPACLLIARDGDRSAVDGLRLTLTDDASKADLVIISASEGDKYPERYYSEQLQAAAERRTPCLCTNPDKLMLTPQGIRFGAGRIAELYERLGGVVQWIGKPYVDVYEHSLKFLQGITPDRILCIGDSLEHDIAGGANAGLKTLFVRNGIHRDMHDAQLARYMDLHQAIPDYQMHEIH